MFYEKIIIKMKTAEEENCFHEIQKGGFYHGRLEEKLHYLQEVHYLEQLVLRF